MSSCVEAFQTPCDQSVGFDTLLRFDVNTLPCNPASGARQVTKVDSHDPVVITFVSPSMINALLDVLSPASKAAGSKILDATVTVIVLTAAGNGDR